MIIRQIYLTIAQHWSRRDVWCCDRYSSAALKWNTTESHDDKYTDACVTNDGVSEYWKFSFCEFRI